jgi:hypothetical protein
MIGFNGRLCLQLQLIIRAHTELLLNDVCLTNLRLISHSMNARIHTLL